MAVVCDPVELVAAAACFKCLPADVGPYLLCRWANKNTYVTQDYIAGEGGEYIAGEGSGEQIEEE